MFKKNIKIGRKTIGRSQPAYIVAEIGINHNGDMELAKKIIAAAKVAGADAVKFQNYQTEDFLSDRNLTYHYVSAGVEMEEPQYDMFKRCELTQADMIEMAACCRQHDLDFHSTPTSKQGIDMLCELGSPVLKNGSDYLVNLELIQHMGKTGLPVVLSTGMATLAEIDDAVRFFAETGNRQLVLLHCTSSYPAHPDDINLRRINSLRHAFGALVGFSDHSEGVIAAVAAVASGACWIEKHFTLTKDLPGPDHRFSADPAEMAELVRAVRDAEAMIGSAAIIPCPTENVSRQNFRLSCVAAQNIDKGTIISRDDIIFQRPGTGYPPKMVDFLIGMKTNKQINQGEVIKKWHLQEVS